MRFPIIIGCDCDPDRVGFSLLANNTKLNWDGVATGIPAFRHARRQFFEQTGIWVCMTWFVRADSQVEGYHGTAGYCLEHFKDLWLELEEEGDEVAWHPHLWTWNKELECWTQSIGDERFSRECLSIGFDAFKHFWGRAPQTVHAGWCYQDSITLAFMAEKGLLADCSALPGHNTLNHGLADQADWSRVPVVPYWPSIKDYQQPAQSAEDVLNLLQIPASVGSATLARVLKIFRDQLKRRSFKVRYQGFRSQVPLMTLPEWLNGPLLDDAVHRALGSGAGYFFSYTHCDEFLPQSGKSGLPRIIYSLDALFSNVQRLHKRLLDLSMEPEYQTLAHLATTLRTRIAVPPHISKSVDEH